MPNNGPTIDLEYLQDVLMRLLAIHSPTGYTDAVVRLVCEELDSMRISYELTRRGAIRGNIPGKVYSPDRAVVTHLDTLGAIVNRLKDNGRLGISPIGTWSSRFAEGARVSIYGDRNVYRGTILPLLASGHAYDDAVDKQPVTWDQLEVRIDERVGSRQDLLDIGLAVGDFIGVDSSCENSPSGFINARHLDDKAGVACLLACIRTIVLSGLELPVDVHALFTISEEVGSGASAVLHGDVAEMVSVDNASNSAVQNCSDYGVTIAMADSSGPFDYHLTRHLCYLCESGGIDYQRDVFRHYRCDSASAIESGNDIRTALVCFAVDASHGYERTHRDSLAATTQLLMSYLMSPPLFRRESKPLSPLDGFPSTREAPVKIEKWGKVETPEAGEEGNSGQ